MINRNFKRFFIQNKNALNKSLYTNIFSKFTTTTNTTPNEISSIDLIKILRKEMSII